MSFTPKVALGAEFLSAFADIPRKKQNKVKEFVGKFRKDPRSTSINYEKIRDGGDHLYSVRIDRVYRGIIYKASNGNAYILLWVDHHDDAYDWARRHKLIVHPETGSLQVLSEEDIESAKPAPRVEEIAPKLRLLRKLKDRHLTSFGVPPEMISVLREVYTEKELDKVGRSLPEEAYDCLLMFVAEFSVAEILAEIQGPEPEEIDTDDIEKALTHNDSRRRFWVVENELELAAMLESPLEKWRVFLHPSQRRLVERDWNGPVRVLGGAGTGKTVAAIHRAKWLAENRFTGVNDRILFTTYTKNLAEDIRAALESITTHEIMRRIEIVNIDEWVFNFLKRNNYGFSPVYGKGLDEYWNLALALAPEGFADSFFYEEWGKVILPQGIDSCAEYLYCSREGRGTPLSRKYRKAIWPVFEELRTLLQQDSLRAPVDAIRDARHILNSKPDLLPYNTVIVDEAQDMGPQEFMLIKAILAGKADKNSLFIVGDAHQRIYRKKVVLGRTGISIKGRSKKLRINYRTTEENRNWAVALLKGLSFDDLDGGIDTQNGYRSLIHGAAPEVHKFNTFEEEIDFIVGKIAPLVSELRNVGSVCIAVRTNKLALQYSEELKKHGLSTCIIKHFEKDSPDNPGVRIATMHRVKGLEFNTMIVASANKGIIPHSKAITGSDSVTANEGIKAEKALLYVAVTRARKNVFITGYGEMSEWLDLHTSPQPTS